MQLYDLENIATCKTDIAKIEDDCIAAKNAGDYSIDLHEYYLCIWDKIWVYEEILVLKKSVSDNCNGTA